MAFDAARQMQPSLPRRLAFAVILSEGWARRAIALVSGGIGALAMAPFNMTPALIVPMAVAVWLLDGAAGEGSRWAALRGAFWTGWWWGFGFFLAGLWWLGAAFLVEADKFAWALPLGVVGLPAVLAFFPALGFALARLIWTPGAARVLALAAALAFSEWLRAHLFTGFPWNAYGMALASPLALAQSASLIGLSGLNLLAVALAASPATLVDSPRAGRFREPVALAALLVIVMGVYGSLRLGLTDTALVPNVRLRIMQPNLPQDAKFRPEQGEAILRDYLGLSDRATSPATSGIADVTHLIWPESPFPFVLGRNPQALAAIGGALGPGTILVTGAVRAQENGAGRRDEYFNAIQAYGQGGQLLASADKVHLVPFGEYLPLQGLLRALRITQFVHVPGGFTAGRARRALDVPGLPAAAPLICYEAIFSGDVLPPAGPDAPRPQWLLNLTNDGWFGQTSGPYQHFAQARLRAIEEGLPLVRAANTGISAVVDPLGRILASLPLGVADVLDSSLPKAGAPTVFSQWRDWPAFALWLVMLAWVVWSRRRGARP